MDLFLILLAIGILIFSYIVYELYQQFLDYQFISSIKRCSSCHEEIKDPIPCKYCHKQFCKKHQHPYYHQCREWSLSSPLYKQCSSPGCRKESYLPRKCNYCGRFFCDQHALPYNHNCENIESYKHDPNPAGVTTFSKNGKIFTKK